jgi:hypothetical protein
MAEPRMNAGWLLLGLLAIAFVGSNVARGRGVRGFGLPSGSEWILTGIALGPQLLGVVRFKDLSLFSPVLAAGLGWVAMAIGMRFAVCLRPNLQQEGRAPRRALGVGALVALVTACMVAYVAYDLLGRFGAVGPRWRLGTAFWIGCALSGSARQLVDWSRERHGAQGATTDAIEAVAGGGEIIALSGTAPLSVLVFSDASELSDVLWRAALPLVLGLLLGLVALWLLHFEVRVAETWGILLGVQLLSAGLSLRAGSSVIAAGFVLGWLLGRDQRAGAELRRMTHPAEGTVLLPLLVVAGASLDLSAVGRLGWLVAAVVGARFAVKILLARMVRGLITGQALPTSPLGLSLASSGEIACLVALGYTLSTPGQLGQLVLACAIVASLFGELYGARGLRHLLLAVNELGPNADNSAGGGGSATPETTGWM